MSVLPNGQIWVGWNDRRDDANNFLSKWYQAHSNDEGATWLDINNAPGNDVVADVQTQPSTFIGDYHGLGASGNGVGNVLGMWFDSRNASSGDAYTDPQVPPPPGPSPTASPAPTPTPPASPSSTPPPTPTPTPCDSGIIQNGGFETGSFPPWVIDGPTNDPVIATNFVHTGTDSAFAGGNPQQSTYCEENSNEPLGDSSFYQQFTVPAGTSIMSFYHKDCTNDSISFDWQDAYITDSN